MQLTTVTTIALFLSFASSLPTQQTDSPSAFPDTASTPSPSASTAHLEIRQGVAVTAAPVAATDIPGQVSPITTVQIGVVKDGVYTQIQELYTQTFASPVDQWPSATQGSIGLGTIAGTIGVIKTKRDAPPEQTRLPVPQTEVLTLESLREMMDTQPIEHDTYTEKRDLVLTTEALDVLMAALPIEDAAGEKKRDLILTTKLLDKMMAALPVEDASHAKREALTTEEQDSIMVALPVEDAK